MIDKDLNLNPGFLLNKLTQVEKELAILYQISNAMQTTLELEHLLYIILTGVTTHSGLGFNRAALFLITSEERCLECKMVIGPESGDHAASIWKFIESSKKDLEDLIDKNNLIKNGHETSLFRALKEIKVPLSQDTRSILATAFHYGSPLHLQGDQLNQYVNDPVQKIFNSHELVIVPLKAKDKVNGLIWADNLYTHKPIVEDDIKIFSMLANQAGLAVENAQLYEMVVHKSRTDSLTGLWNHGYFQDKLMEEIEKASRLGEILTLVCIDIDHFKIFNDTFGHQKGDIILKELANILKISSRDQDHVCRYGGEEFVIILVQTNKEQGYTIAERLREKIAQHPFCDQMDGQNFHMTVSMGLATYPKDSLTKEELLNQADKAMYIAKFSGRNMTCLVNKENSSHS